MPHRPRPELASAADAIKIDTSASGGASTLPATPPRPAQPVLARRAFQRLWRNFVNARILVGLMLLLLQAGLYLSGRQTEGVVLLWCLAYLVLTGVERFNDKVYDAQTLPRAHWRRAVIIDLIAYSGLLWLPAEKFNYTPLFAVPVLTSAVLGSRRMALGTATVVALVMLANTGAIVELHDPETTSRLFQTALSCVGYFFIALLAHYLTARLVHEQQRMHFSQQALGQLSQVNALVIEHLSDGVLVVDGNGIVRAFNPAARHMLTSLHDESDEVRRIEVPFSLRQTACWHSLADIAVRTIEQAKPHSGMARLTLEGASRRVHARTRLTPESLAQERLCVMFLQDQHEVEARVRTEKMAAMGRMSAAVAHEIRNPLMAILQANQLLGEVVQDATQQKLTGLVDQNVQRLNRIVDDILEVAHLVPGGAPVQPFVTLVASTVWGIVDEWMHLHQRAVLLHQTVPDPISIPMDPEHLRRVLVNLLNNALRYASNRPGGIQVWSETPGPGRVDVTVWSDGADIDAALRSHLFEPFFSSESRSSGLGLYICRELCERYGGSIAYRRLSSPEGVEGNAFVLNLPAATSGH